MFEMNVNIKNTLYEFVFLFLLGIVFIPLCDME